MNERLLSGAGSTTGNDGYGRKADVTGYGRKRHDGFRDRDRGKLPFARLAMLRIISPRSLRSGRDVPLAHIAGFRCHPVLRIGVNPFNLTPE